VGSFLTGTVQDIVCWVKFLSSLYSLRDRNLQFQYTLSPFCSVTKVQARSSIPDVQSPRLYCESTNTKTAPYRVPFLYLCSHQGSNLDRRYRKPTFYPLNYESIRSSSYFLVCSPLVLRTLFRLWLLSFASLPKYHTTFSLPDYQSPHSIH
jgi:hypothetical protein